MKRRSGGDHVGEGVVWVRVVEEACLVPVGVDLELLGTRLGVFQHLRGDVDAVRLRPAPGRLHDERAGPARQIDQTGALRDVQPVEQGVVGGGVGALVPVVRGDGVRAAEIDADGCVLGEPPGGAGVASVISWHVFM
nr:hypothetical protein [Nonomuraea deserti]